MEQYRYYNRRQHRYKKSRQIKRRLAYVGVIILALLLLIQIFYPSSRMILFSKIDGVSVGWQSKSDTIAKLDQAYLNQTLPIHFGQSANVYADPKLTDVGISVSNKTRIDNTTYPWFLRVIPTSIFWAHFLTDTWNQPSYQRDVTKLNDYVTNLLGESCYITTTDASLKASGSKLELIASQDGGTCSFDNVHRTLLGAKPIANSNVNARIALDGESKPAVSDSDATSLGDILTDRIGKGISVQAKGSTITMPVEKVLSWLDFGVSAGKLIYTVDSSRSNSYLGNLVAISPGTTVVDVYNYVEKSRAQGVIGKQLDIDTTIANIKSFLDGKAKTVAIATTSIDPSVSYNRTYGANDVAITDLMTNFAQTHNGVYGVSMAELSGKNRIASYNFKRVFTTASTYKLFVAYSTLRRIEAGTWHWSDYLTSGRSLSKCFDDMIEKSDNTCAEAMLTKVGRPALTSEAQAIGCVNTSFLGSDIQTTPADLTLFLSDLQTGRILGQQSSRDRLISAMKLNVYRAGIPTGLSGITVADKVGFLDAMLHDASIVYDPVGTFVLVIMTDYGSSWANIANLAHQIEALRVQ